MITATSLSVHSKTQEINNNESPADREEYPNEDTLDTVSVAVGRDTASKFSRKQQQQQKESTCIRDECSYVGDIYAEKKHGYGVLSWSDGRTYTGAFYADQRHGFGTFQTPNSSEFRGLYRQDERFGPGILIYPSSQSADVGFWLSESLVRLLYPHPTLNMDIQITDKKSSSDSSFVMPSWYSPEELLSSVVDFDFILKKKPSTLFCKNIEDEHSFVTRYLIDHVNRIGEAMHDKRAQLDAYLMSIDKEDRIKEEMLTKRTVDFSSPNENYEQRQLYYYTNKFWPLKQRATFPIDEILSNTRSAFPNAGLLEIASLNLFECAFNGQSKDVRDLLMQRQVYVDICDSRGLTPLHFATYNVHITVVNILLDFGANVNQLSDNGLTPLSIAFLLYYGNNPQQIDNLAFEHVDPILLVPRPIPVVETRRSSTKDKLIQQSRTTFNSPRNLISRESTIEEEEEDKSPMIAASVYSLKVNDAEKKNSYGYRLTENFSERIQNQQFRESVYCLIKLLLRRGADPSISDWPLPVLALAIRAGDKDMVELLLKKKAQVNCRLNANRNVYLTPLHIACGCLTSNAIDIVRALLKYGANVNVETLPGGKEYLSLADPAVLELKKIRENEEHGRTPLHIACARESSVEALALVRLLLDNNADPNVVCNGQTPLSLAIVNGNEPLVNILLEHETTDPSVSLGFGNVNALCLILSTIYEPRWTYPKRIELIERLIAKNPRVLYPIRYGPKNLLGSAVDYAHYSYFADIRLSQTPYHSLVPADRILLKERKDLLTYIGKRFREEVTKYNDFLRLPTPLPDDPSPTPSGLMLLNRTVSRARSLMTDKTGDVLFRTSDEFQYCATCGRSNGVRLTFCKRCQRVSFCSKACKVSGWNSFHKDECQPINPDRAVTTTKTISSKGKLPSIRPSTHQTEGSQLQSTGTSGTRLEAFTTLGGPLFKGSILENKTPFAQSQSRFPTLSVAKLIRQKRLKKMGKAGAGNLPPTLPSNLSWNPIYNAPENYSFN